MSSHINAVQLVVNDPNQVAKIIKTWMDHKVGTAEEVKCIQSFQLLTLAKQVPPSIGNPTQPQIVYEFHAIILYEVQGKTFEIIGGPKKS